jgi:hypothetical protein
MHDRNGRRGRARTRFRWRGACSSSSNLLRISRALRGPSSSACRRRTPKPSLRLAGSVTAAGTPRIGSSGRSPAVQTIRSSTLPGLAWAERSSLTAANTIWIALLRASRGCGNGGERPPLQSTWRPLIGSLKFQRVGLGGPPPQYERAVTHARIGRPWSLWSCAPGAS